MNTRNSVNQVNKVNPINFLLFILCFLFFIISSSYAAQLSNPPSSTFTKEGGQKKIIAQGGERGLTDIALFPFENFSEDKNAVTFVMPLLKDRLEAKGFRVLDDDSLNRFLLKERIRSTGYISRDMARKLGEELNVKAVLVGSIDSFYTGGNPKIGFSVRLIDTSDGTIIWANHASATGQDFTGILGLGRVKTIDRLASKVLDKLVDSFGIAPPYKERESTYRIAVMPFRNESKIKDAAKIATYMFIVELFNSKRFEPLSYGDVRNLVVNLRFRGKGEIDYKYMKEISGASGVDGILVGTVELYKEGEGTAPPEAVISARLINARTDRVLWYDSYQYRGDEGIFILDWGRIRSAENVAYKVVSELVKEMDKAKWY
jgi:TolB-like protein